MFKAKNVCRYNIMFKKRLKLIIGLYYYDLSLR